MTKCRRIKKEKLNSKYFNEWVLNNINDYFNRYEIYYGGGGSGKSYGAVQKIIIKAMFNKRKVLVVRKVGNTIRFSIYALFKSILSKTGTAFRENKTEMTMTLENGSMFIFKGIDDPEKIKSIADITDIVIEEASELTEDDFTQLDIRLRPSEEYPQIYLMFNPVSKVNWVYKHWFSQNIPERTKIIHTTYRDNKFLSDDYRKTLESLIETNPSYYKIYCLGEFATLDKLVYSYEIKDFDYRIISKRNNVKSAFGLDFGYINDETALGCLLVDTDKKELWIFDEHYQKGMLNNEIADMIKYKGYSKEKIIADSAEKKSIDEIVNYGISGIIPAKKGPDSLLNGIQYMQQYKIYLHPKCVNFKVELDNYTWQKDKKTNEYINKPIDAYNHLLDSARYALEPFMLKSKEYDEKIYAKGTKPFKERRKGGVIF